MVSENQIKLGKFKQLLESKAQTEETLKTINTLYFNLQNVSIEMRNTHYDALHNMEKQVSEELDKIRHEIFMVEAELFNKLE
jgi:hypothetical protein